MVETVNKVKKHDDQLEARNASISSWEATLTANDAKLKDDFDGFGTKWPLSAPKSTNNSY